MKILVTICARGGSKGLPGKNIKKLNGKPLIGYTIDQSFSLKEYLGKHHLLDIILSTDSDRIKEVASSFNLNELYTRPNELASDSASKVSVIKKALYYKEHQTGTRYDYILDLDVTSPLRTTEDLIRAINFMKKNTEVLTLFSVSPAHRNPYFNMVEIDEQGYAKLIKPLSENIFSRQKAPIVYDMNASFYIYKRIFFDDPNNTTVFTPKSIAFELDHVCFDIDTQLDFDIMEYLLNENKINFSFK